MSLVGYHGYKQDWDSRPRTHSARYSVFTLKNNLFLYVLIQVTFLAQLRIVYDEEKILTIWICVMHLLFQTYYVWYPNGHSLAEPC